MSYEVWLRELEMFSLGKRGSEAAHHSFKPFEGTTRDKTRGHSLNLHQERFRLDIRENFFTGRVVKDWNALLRKDTTPELTEEMLVIAPSAEV